ncbi:MAG: alpha/beta fold hydrolase, partial [Maritimibacter sp.]|nr:alpha/beta fold hydrolase [Maritimibacter sp.]
WGWIKEQPVHRTPAPDWEASITLPGVAAVPFTVPVAGATLEALMLKPEASGPVGAVVFAGGSGDGLFQAYAPGFLKTYLQDIFLPRDIAVVYVNKRGMGASTGNWMNNTIEGRAADINAVAAAVRAMAGIDPARVGLAGHSQGGWVVIEAAAADPATAFVLDLMGPLRSTWDQFDNMWHNVYACDGREGASLERACARKAWITRAGMAVGGVLPIGMLEFDRHFFTYDNEGLLAQISAPMLAVYGGTDILVDGPANEVYLRAAFPDGVPDNFEAVTLPGLNHSGYQRADICDETTGTGPQDASPELTATLEDWLSRIGY